MTNNKSKEPENHGSMTAKDTATDNKTDVNITADNRTIEVGLKGKPSKETINLGLARGEKLCLEVEALEGDELSVKTERSTSTQDGSQHGNFINIPESYKKKFNWIYNNFFFDIKNTAEVLGTAAGVGIKYFKQVDRVFVSKINEIKNILINNRGKED